jgi:y4mF family transcriptional regulator
MELKNFIKEKRRLANLTQPDLADKAGVGLRFVREMEQGKETLRMDKVNQVLKLFGYQLGPMEMARDYTLQAEPGQFNITGGNVKMTKKVRNE